MVANAIASASNNSGAFQPYLANLFTLIFTRLQNCKTMKFIRSFLVFLALFIGRHGASPVVHQIDSIQQQLFKMVLESLWLPNIQKVSGNIERKMCAIAMVKLLTDCPQMLTEAYFPSWYVLFSLERQKGYSFFHSGARSSKL